MKKSLTTICLLFSLLFADRLTIERMDTTLPHRQRNEPVDVSISLVVEGRDLKDERYKIIDVIQTALGRFDAYTLIKAQGKEALKSAIVDLADKRYGIEIDFVYIQNIRLETDTLRRCWELIHEGSRLQRRR